MAPPELPGFTWDPETKRHYKNSGAPHGFIKRLKASVPPPVARPSRRVTPGIRSQLWTLHGRQCGLPSCSPGALAAFAVPSERDAVPAPRLARQFEARIFVPSTARYGAAGTPRDNNPAETFPEVDVVGINHGQLNIQSCNPAGTGCPVEYGGSTSQWVRVVDGTRAPQRSLAVLAEKRNNSFVSLLNRESGDASYSAFTDLALSRNKYTCIAASNQNPSMEVAVGGGAGITIVQLQHPTTPSPQKIEPVEAIDFRVDSTNSLLFGTRRGFLGVYDTRSRYSRSPTRCSTTQAGPLAIYAIQCLQDGVGVITAGWSSKGVLQKFDMRQLDSGPVAVYNGHRNAYKRTCVDCNERRDSLVALGDDQVLRVWDMRFGGDPIKEHSFTENVGDLAMVRASVWRLNENGHLLISRRSSYV